MLIFQTVLLILYKKEPFQQNLILTKHIYLFSGLGADERIFQKLDFSGYFVSFIRWEVPMKKESIEHYAARLINQITTDRPILIGLSFGGLIAIEIAKQIETEKVILISSARTKKEIPTFYRLGGKLRLQKLLPLQLLKGKNLFSDWVFRDASDSEKQLLKSIFSDTNSTFLKWAIDKAVSWKNETCLKNITHIHGTSDRIFPIRLVTCDVKVENGGHLLTLKNAEEISGILKTILS
jgi:pimeloyl-ACP methyl ester carboxylesterase